MTSRDIYVSRLLFGNDREALAREFANAIKHEISSRHWDDVLGPLRFVFVPKDARAPFATAYVAFYNRNIHHAAIDLLNGLLFKGEVTQWRLGDNDPRRTDEVPPGAQYNADRSRRNRTARYGPYDRSWSRLAEGDRPGCSGRQQHPKEETQSREPTPPPQPPSPPPNQAQREPSPRNDNRHDLEEAIHVLELNQASMRAQLALITRQLAEQPTRVTAETRNLEAQVAELEHQLRRTRQFAAQYPAFSEFLNSDDDRITPSQTMRTLQNVAPRHSRPDYYS